MRVLAGLGRFLVTAGILILLFVAYQLWGTGLYTDREQNRLRDEFISELSDEDQQTGPTTTGPPAPTTTTTAPTAPPPAPAGEAIAQVRIPKIALDTIVINGVTRADLRKAPGHYPDTPLPGQRGNSAIAGHRTTYGSPFANLDQLASGDTIVVRTLEDVFEFRVTEKRVVNPTDIGVLEPTKEDPADPASELAATLTLTTCEPKYSAAQRLIIKAELKADEVPLPAPAVRETPQLSEEGLSGEESSKLPTVISGAIAALVGALWWLVFHRHPRWTNWIVGAIPFAIALFLFYSFLERVLPANY